ncbi:MAG: hypothetical protein FWE40_04425 [Oscillospiraceae bacterium]|jgi:uncharacterized phage-associated protein|nr:hypothetical protein [Oscillospiraceae bacterium]
MNNLPSIYANNIIEWGDWESIRITHLELQKLLYLFFARFAYLSKVSGENELIPFDECPVRWQNGPVFVSVYHNFKKHGSQPVSIYRNDDGSISKVMKTDERFRKAFFDVIKLYGTQTASFLVGLTHGDIIENYETAWEKAAHNQPLSLDDIVEDGRVFFAA